MADRLEAPPRARLSRDRVLAAAVSLADEIGLDALSMRRLADELDVVPMALYKHVADKEDLLDGMVEVLVREIELPPAGLDWRTGARRRVLSARRELLRHPWGRQAIESRKRKTPAVLEYMDSLIGLFLADGFSADLTHHVMHAIGGRMWGFTQEVFEEPPAASTSGRPAMPTPISAAEFEQLTQHFPNIATMAAVAQHDDGTVVARGCDDQFEFEFALDLMLDGIERLHRNGWTPADAELTRR